MHKKITILIFVLTILFIPNSVFALGQMTEPILIKNALRGNEYQEIITIVNNEKTQAIINVSVQGDIIDWVQFYLPNNLQDKIDSVTIAASQNKNVTVIFSIPEDAPNGEYKGIINVTKKPEEMSAQEGSSVSISQEIGREVTIIVGGEEEIGLQVSVIPESYDIKKNKPLDIRFIFDNLGNISLRPQIDLKIKNLDQQVVYNAIYPYPENELAVKPNAQYEIPIISVSTNSLEKGKYFVEIDFLHNNLIIFEKNFKFSIGNKGFVLGISDWKINWWIISIAILIILVALSLIFVKKNKRVSVL